MSDPSAAHAEAASRIDAAFARHGVRLTIGGEPTFVPVDPEGAEWRHAAVGPTKLARAWDMATHLLAGPARNGGAFFAPGKLYPGELDPRWAIWIVMRRDGRPLMRLSGRGEATPERVRRFVIAMAKRLGVGDRWRRFDDAVAMCDDGETWGLLLDHDESGWHAAKWPAEATALLNAAGPAGLRLPLHLLPEGVPRRAVVVERREGSLSIFLPPLLQPAFIDLLECIEECLALAGIGSVQLQGAPPPDELAIWTTIGLSADPGVLEVNLPACGSWREYDRWIHEVTSAAAAAGLRPWREPVGGTSEETGGGNHLLWGGPTPEENPFFGRPGWIASILRYWHRHPALAYCFTGKYVGRHSQAPRPDESGWAGHDLEWAWSYLESLPAGDQRLEIAETVRHLQSDVNGNGHRSEICFDKFWNAGRPSPLVGLVEFRAIGSLPRPEWSSAVALLWSAVGVRLLDRPCRETPREFGRELHDRCLLPSWIWDDLCHVLADVAEAGIPLGHDVYRGIWEWRFPVLLEFRDGDAVLTARQAPEPWPLLAETPADGSQTSRFVDASLHRIEFVANRPFIERFRLGVGGKSLPLRPVAMRHAASDGGWLAGLRYRRSRLRPSLHPGIPCDWPLEVFIEENDSVHHYVLSDEAAVFRRMREAATGRPRTLECLPIREGDVTFDLRVGSSGRGTSSA